METRVSNNVMSTKTVTLRGLIFIHIEVRYLYIFFLLLPCPVSILAHIQTKFDVHCTGQRVYIECQICPRQYGSNLQHENTMYEYTSHTLIGWLVG